MVLHRAIQRLHPKWPRRNMLQWRGVIAVGVAAASFRSITTGNFRQLVTPGISLWTGYTSIANAFSKRLSFSTFTIPSQTPSTTMPIVPPQPPPEWTHTPDDVTRLTKEAIDTHRTVEDTVGALPASECTYESLALETAETDFEAVTEPLSFYQNVSPSKELRDASTAADGLMRDYGVESSMRIDVYEAKLNAEKAIKKSGLWEKLSSEEQRLIDKMARLGLPEAERDTLKALQKELSQVCLEFDKNFNEENGVISFTKEELDGVPADVISGYKKREEGSEELYDVTYKTPDIFPVFKFATRPETRQRAYEGHESRLAINVPLAEKFLGFRREIAKVLKYPTWADYRTEPKMVKTGKGVVDFLDDLQNKLTPVGIKDRETLLALKKKEHEERGIPFDGEFYIWDYRYYDRKYIETSLELDDMLVKEYFPVSVVVPAIMDIYQKMLSVRFEKMDGTVWHPEIQQFSVWEKDATDESGFVGYCYLDLFPRESKYSHAAVWPLLSGYTKADGKRSYPLTAMVANLAKATPDKPALMRHDDVVTFFHEMGHVFHGLLSQTKFSKFHGTKVARDFVEASPFSFLTATCWEREVLEKMSSHYKTQVNLYSAFIKVFFAKFDIKVHTDQESEDYTLLWNKLREEISLVKSEKPCPGHGSFGHISGGLYTYSLVFASDMYATVFKGDPLDPARGKLYRDKILKLAEAGRSLTL
ncbi:metallopeptidase MepB [Favolaschia claudopus]|uniref:Metallopeptidase MepB n=1 Tax=Favolaschia claudopus TaxID=2862362 RepID=A0AAW0DB32_9AGAR